jgi:hypothetical protein
LDGVLLPVTQKDNRHVAAILPTQVGIKLLRTRQIPPVDRQQAIARSQTGLGGRSAGLNFRDGDSALPLGSAVELQTKSLPKTGSSGSRGYPIAGLLVAHLRVARLLVTRQGLLARWWLGSAGWILILAGS